MPGFGGTPGIGALGNPIDSFKRFFDAQTPEVKQQILNSLGEAVGGTLGAVGGALGGSAIAPGPGSFAGGVLGAGAGSGLGHEAAQWLGPKVGAAGPSGDASTRLGALSGAVGLGMVGEGAGRLIPAAWRGAKALAKAPFKPTDAALRLRQLAIDEGLVDAAGRPLLDVAQASGRSPAYSVKMMLERFPTSVGKIEKSDREQLAAYKSLFDNLMDNVSTGNVSEEDFHRIARGAITNLRQQFAGEMEAGLAEASAKFPGERVVKVTPSKRAPSGEVRMIGPESSFPPGGESIGGPKVATELSSLPKALVKNRQAIEAWADRTFTPIRKAGVKYDLDVSRVAATAKNMLPESQWADIAGTMKGSTRKLLNAISGREPSESPEMQAAMKGLMDSLGASTVDEVRTKAPALYESYVAKLAQDGISAEIQPSAMKLSELIQLRSELLSARRSQTFRTKGIDQRAVSSIAKAIDDTIESQLPKLDRSLYSKWRAANARYSEMRQAVDPLPATQVITDKPAGNVMSATIGSPSKLPDELMGDIVRPGGAERLRLTEQAVDPTTVGRPPETRNPILDVRSLALSQMAEKSRVPDYLTRGNILLPSKFGATVQRTIGGAEPQLFEGGVPAVRSLYADPSRQTAERLLYESALAKGVEDESAKGIIRKAFPPKSPVEAAFTVAQMRAANRLPEAQRGLIQNIVEAGEQPGGAYLASKSARAAESLGETLPAVVGDPTARKMGNLFELGENLSAQSGINKVGGSARGYAVERALGRVTGLQPTFSSVTGAASSLAGPAAVARGFTSPRVSSWLTSPAESVFPTGIASESLKGAAARLPLQMPPPFEPRVRVVNPSTGESGTVDSREISDPQVLEDMRKRGFQVQQ